MPLVRSYLQQIEEDVWAPAEDEDEDDDEGHLDCLHLGFRDQASGRGPPRFDLVLSTAAIFAANLFRQKTLTGWNSFDKDRA